MISEFRTDFYINNRKRLSEKLPNSLILISANSLLQKSADTTFPFRQDSNFWYLTGLDEPDFVLAMDTNTERYILFSPEQNEYQKQWDGENNTKQYQKISGISKYDYMKNLEKLIKESISQKMAICYLEPLPDRVEPYGFYSNPARNNLLKIISKYEKAPTDIRKNVARLRQIKQPEEIAALKEAISITGRALRDAKAKIGNYKTEKELENSITASFYESNSNGHGYDPIVASGVNAATIHYTENQSNIGKDNLILLDVGATVGYYSADISRTWSAGKPNKRQQDVFDAVLEIQDYGVSLLKPDVFLKDFQKKMEDKTKQLMKKLKCINAEDKFPHGFSHFLGLDVHDAGDYDLSLQENMVLTVEPGIYLKDEGIGVRIEDNIIITKNSNENLSAKIPRIL